MAGQDINTMTPGSAVADSLEDILTRKRNESRQAMLDSVTRQSAQARANYENAAAASLTEQREAHAQEQKSIADKNRMAAMGQNPGDVDKSTYDWGSKVSPGSFRMASGGATLPSTATTGIGSTLPTGAPSIGPTPTPAAQPPALPVQSTSVPSTPDTSVPATYRYQGSPQYQQRQQTIQSLQDLTKDPSFANNPNLVAELKLATALPQYNPEGAVERIMTARNAQKPGRAISLDEATGKWKDSAGNIVTDANANDKVERIPRAANIPAGDTPFISGTIEDPITHIKTPSTFRVSPAMIGKDGLVRYPAGFTPEGKLGSAPRAPQVKPAKVDDRDWALYLNAKSAALRAPDDAKTEDLLNSQANKVINTSTNDPAVRAFISKAWTYKQARSVPADVLMSKMKEGSTPLTDPQKQEITQIWNQLKFDPQGQ